MVSSYPLVHSTDASIICISFFSSFHYCSCAFKSPDPIIQYAWRLGKETEYQWRILNAQLCIFKRLKFSKKSWDMLEVLQIIYGSPKAAAGIIFFLSKLDVWF